MKPLSYVRFLTYLAIGAIALLVGQQRKFIPVQLEQPEYPPLIKPLDTSTWLQQNEKWLGEVFKEALPAADIRIASPYTEIPTGVRELLARKVPGYSGVVRRVHWVQSAPGFVQRTYEIFLYQTGEGWIVLDVGSWEVQFKA